MDTSPLPPKQSVAASRILVVDDDPDACTVIEMALQRNGHHVRTATTSVEALSYLADEIFDVVVSDIGMDGMNGFDLCERVLGTKPDTQVIISTGQTTMESAVTAIRAGAFDFLVKPLDLELLSVSVARALTHRRLKEEVKLLSEGERQRPGGMIGDSAAMKRSYDLIGRVSASDASVLIRGESGTGKELAARAVHKLSPRGNGPFVAINCAAVPPTLLESELFGHARGAFTDAKTAREGLFVRASGGTLFLDEIGEMPLDVQPKLLRALQERKVRPVGGSDEVSFDARVVVATNRNLEDEIAEGRFREDLFYRINVVTVELPPLRERSGDALTLANRFLERFSELAGKEQLSLSQEAADRLSAYPWPGNVRELENAMERAVTLARTSTIEIADLPDKVASFQQDKLVVDADEPSQIVTMDELERRYLLRVLKLGGGNKSRAAKLLGLDRRTLYRKLERWEASGTVPGTGRNPAS